MKVLKAGFFLELSGQVVATGVLRPGASKDLEHKKEMAVGVTAIL